MTEPSDTSALEARLDAVHGQLLELNARVAYIEAYLRGAPTPEVRPPAIQAVQAVQAVQATAIPIAAAAATAWQPSVLEEPAGPSPTSSPIRVLALTGGVALLLGLGFFVVYAIEQAWIPPSVRFVLAAIASALLTIAAWPIARRGYEAVAGAIGGAGLGGWFAAWLVAHHVHALVSLPQTFVALVVGAAACLLIADRLRLRLMAGLASAAACATPGLVSTGESGLHALMIYQLLVIGGLVALDARRGWPELPTIGLIATWVLAGGWGVTHLDVTLDPALLGWAVVLLGASAGSGWRLVAGQVEQVDAIHVVVRLLIAGAATWAFAAACLELDTRSFALATALLSAWHVGLAVLLRARATTASELFVLFAWVQALLFGPIRLDDAGLASWWIGLALALTLIPWVGLQRVRRPTLTVTALAAVFECTDAEASWSLPIGLLAAAVLVLASLWRYPHEPRAGGESRPISWLSVVATLAWGLVVGASGPNSTDSTVALLALALVPNATLLGWACARPSEHATIAAVVQLGLGLAAAILATVEIDALSLNGHGDVGARLGLAVVVLGFAGLGGLCVALVRATTSPTWLGLLTAPSLILAGLLAVAGIADGTPALGQVGYSLTIAAVGLTLIVAGLRMQEALWRQTGLAALGLAAAKIVLFDLDAAAVGWRALSFVGLGVILIGGSFAYSRAARRVAPTAKP